ncbi:GNAT family N-acetyltransferase [Clostridium botulinum]|nr:GNAT family N-acetyltransferase [Clostridium botulinum]
MNNKFKVSIELAKGTVDEYIVKDITGISIGRILILELYKKNKYGCFRLNLYRDGENSNIYLNYILKDFLQYLFYKKEVCKINIIINENMNTNVFIEYGFYLEGIINDSRLIDGIKTSEFLFGLDIDTFRKANLYKELSIEGKNISLKLLTPINAQELLDYYIRNERHLKSYEPTRDKTFYTLKEQRDLLMDSYKQYLNGNSLEFGIYKDKKFIGKIKISNIIMGIFKNCIVGYSIDKDFQGNGYMKEALKLLIDYTFNEIDIHRIEASTLIDNIRSQKVLEGCGFKKLGINEKYLYIDGKWQDHVTYYIVNNNI